MHILFTHTHDLNSWLAMPFIHFKTRPGIHSKRNKHSVRTHGSIPHGADEHNARASINRSQGYCWNTVAGSRLRATAGSIFPIYVKTICIVSLQTGGRQGWHRDRRGPRGRA